MMAVPQESQRLLWCVSKPSNPRPRPPPSAGEHMFSPILFAAQTCNRTSLRQLPNCSLQGASAAHPVGFFWLSVFSCIGLHLCSSCCVALGRPNRFSVHFLSQHFLLYHATPSNPTHPRPRSGQEMAEDQRLLDVLRPDFPPGTAARPIILYLVVKFPGATFGMPAEEVCTSPPVWKYFSTVHVFGCNRGGIRNPAKLIVGQSHSCSGSVNWISPIW